MKLIELHIVQSFPVSCLNRDDVGSPKSAIFGGVPRARISSQCLKRAIRMEAREYSPCFQGIRSRYLKQPFTDALIQAGLVPKDAESMAVKLCELFSKSDTKKPDQITTAVYLSPGEISIIAKLISEGILPEKAIRNVDRLDAADIALFGRMIANDPSLTIEGASMFSHALSTHKAFNDIDFYSAVDDNKIDATDAGAGMIGTLEYNSATYYRYVGVNLDILKRASHIGLMDVKERKSILDAFIRACLMAIPGARKNSMNAASLPVEVLGLFKSKGQPLQLINAFESPVSANGKGLGGTSLEALKHHHETLKDVWGIKPDTEVWLTEAKLENFIKQLTDHVD